MARTVVDLPDDWTIAAEELGTKTKTATVRAALAEVVARRKRREAVATFRAVRLDLDDPEAMRGAWR
jgi:hypothetical protein